MKKITLLVAALLFLVTPLLAAEPETGAEKEIKTKFGAIKVNSTRDDMYVAFPESERLHIPHKILDEEWVVFRNINSDNPHDVITFYLKNGRVRDWKENYNPTPKNEGSPYEFHEGEKIEKWFFPAGEAKWNGDRLTMIEWNVLTESQKVMFLTEYQNELKKEYGPNISIDMAKFILAMNYYADTCPSNCFAKPATDIVKELLVRDGQIASKSAAPSLGADTN
jgi:hypothetical protein